MRRPVAVLLSFVLSPLVNFLGGCGLAKSHRFSSSSSLRSGSSLSRHHHWIPGRTIARHAPEYAATIGKKVLTVREFALDKMSGMLEHLGYNAKPGQAATAPPSAPKVDSPARKQAAPGSQPTNPLALLEKSLSPVLSPFATFGIMVVVAIFVLLQKEALRDRMIRLFASTDLPRTTVAICRNSRIPDSQSRTSTSGVDPRAITPRAVVFGDHRRVASSVSTLRPGMAPVSPGAIE